MALAAARIATERIRLERLGIIGADGELISRVVPPDMLQEPTQGSRPADA
jgi:hypothetical protein